MTYNAKTNWKFDDPVTESDLNRIEQGIKDAHQSLDEEELGLAEHEAKRNNPHNVTKAQVGLENLDNKKQVPHSEKGVANGVATLGPGGKVPAEQLEEINVPVTSVNGKTGDVNLTASDVGAETPIGAQQRVDALAGTGNTKTVRQVDQALTTHSADLTSQDEGKGADLIGLPDADNNFMSSTVGDAMNELFTNVSDGKDLIATAITDKEVPASGSDTFPQLASKIDEIEVGDYNVGDGINPADLGSFSYKEEFTNYKDKTSYTRAIAADKFGNYIYADNDRNLMKDDSNGTSLWRMPRFSTGIIYSLDVDDDANIYVGHANGVQKLNPDGDILWTYSPGSSATVVWYDKFTNQVYLKASVNYVRSLDPSNGTLNWSKSVHSYDLEDIDIDSKGNIYVAIIGGSTYKLDPSGDAVWNCSYDSNPSYTVIATGGKGYSYLTSAQAARIMGISAYGEVEYRSATIRTPFLVADADDYLYYIENDFNLYKSLYGEKVWSTPAGDNSLSKLYCDDRYNIYYTGRYIDVTKVSQTITIEG